ncbi:MAG: GlsB/YeaQ/YmgE family stress response membrane protein [Allosphingosinicella sp.]
MHRDGHHRYRRCGAGGFLGQAIGWYSPGEGAGFLAAIVGAVLILMIYRMFARG